MAVFMTAWFFYASLWILRSPILGNCEGRPKLRGRPRTQYSAYMGDSVKLRCPVSGTDDSEENRTLVAWFKGKKVIQNSATEWQRFLRSKNKHLQIINIQKEDAGIYTCYASNTHGVTKLKINLKVKAEPKPGRGKPPVFKQFPKKKTKYETGETAKLRCHSDGDPYPNVQWFKDGKSYGVGKRTSVGPDGWTLNLRYLTVEHTGNYTCRVSNNVGSINRTFTIIVKARTLKPVIEEPERNRHTARQGRSVKFDCKATSVDRKLLFHWKWSPKNGNNSVNLVTSSQFGTKYIGNYTETNVVGEKKFYFDGFLFVRDVSKKDEGKYTCLVENSHGKDKMNFYLRVKEEGVNEEEHTTEVGSNKKAQDSASNPKTPVVVATRGKVQTKERGIPVTFVAVLTASIIVALIFIVVLIMCCRKQRKDLEKQIVSEYQPQGLFQPYNCQISAYQEMQKRDQNESTFNKSWNVDNNEPVKAFNDARASVQASQNSLGTHCDSKRTKEPSSSSEMYLANSRTSLQTTLCRSCPRETSFDYKGSTNHSLPRTMSPGVLSSLSTPGVLSPGVLPRGVMSSWASSVDRNDRRNWESETSLDNSPRNTSPQRSRESIV